MNKHRLQAELWETQLWIMWILGFLLFHFGGFWAHIFSYIIFTHSAITFIGIMVKIRTARKESAD